MANNSQATTNKGILLAVIVILLLALSRLPYLNLILTAETIFIVCWIVFSIFWKVTPGVQFGGAIGFLLFSMSLLILGYPLTAKTFGDAAYFFLVFGVVGLLSSGFRNLRKDI